MKLIGKIEINGINPYVLISAKTAHSLMPGRRRPIPVKIKVNGKPEVFWHINIVPVGNGDFYLYLHETVRTASATKVGDTVEVEIVYDDEYTNGPQHDMPEEMTLFLKNTPKASENWDALSPSRQKEVLRYLASVKSQEAKKRNLERLYVALLGNATRFMGRDWRDGR